MNFNPWKCIRRSHMTQQIQDNIRTYTQDTFERMYYKLQNHGFTRIDIYTWEYKRENRFIRVIVTSEQYVEVNFNNEKTIYQTPFGVLEGLDHFRG